jgi:hypothetical protein
MRITWWEAVWGGPGIRIKEKSRIRIRIKEKKIEKITEFSCLEMLDVLFWGLKASSGAWASFMEA